MQPGQHPLAQGFAMFRLVVELVTRPWQLLRFERIGPDIFVTHWMLYFPSLMRVLCEKKLGAFGAGSEVRPFAYLVNTKAIHIGRNVVIINASVLMADDRDGAGEIWIEDDVLMGSGVLIYTNNHETTKLGLPIVDQGYPPPSRSDSVVIQSGSWVGSNAILLKGVTIGRNAVVGAGSVVTRSVPAGEVWAGVPARKIR